MKRNRKRYPAPASSAAVAEVAPLAPAAYGFSGYTGAALSIDRAQLWWPNLDTRQELDSFSRDELMRRIRWLFGNEGFIRGIIANSATLVGFQTPQAQSGDEAWDELAEQSFRDSCLTPEVFDHGGKFDFEDAQNMLKCCRFKDGDVLTVLTAWENGRAKVAFYEAHQLRSPSNPPKNQRWKDGVLLGEGDRHLAYGLWDPQTDKVAIVPARDCIYSGKFTSPGYTRAIPPLAHAVNHATDITETWSNIKKSGKVASLFGAIIERDGQAVARARQGLTGPLNTASTGSDTKRIQTADVYASGIVPDLNPGETLKTLSDSRPHPNLMEFVEILIRDIATGFGLPPEVVWQMGRLTGPGVRFILDVADRWIKEQQRIDKRWAKRVWVYYIAREIKAGRLPLPQPKNGGQARWWAVTFTAQRNLTIDRGKESKSRLDEIDAGVGTWSGWDDLDGMDWKARLKQRVREVRTSFEECGITPTPEQLYAAVFKPRQGTAAPAAAGADPSANDTAPPVDEETDL